MENIILDQEITKRLLEWYRKNARDLPWRHNTDPYRVWLSEIMLQQTRVDTVIPYYNRFLQQVPDIAALAVLEEQRLLKLWEGLGYYSRARNLQKAAQIIIEQHGGVFPNEVDAIRKLPGIGDYTAGAIASISFELPTPAVDGNVLRVVARLTATAEVDTPPMKKRISAALADIYPKQGDRGDFTQALMELGAVVCLPNGVPLCDRCPLSGLCKACAAGEQMDYPEKKEKPARKIEEMTVFVLDCGGEIALQQRGPGGVLAGLWQLPNVAGHLDDAAALKQAAAWGAAPGEVTAKATRKHIFTHIEWRMRCYHIRCDEKPAEFTWVNATQLTDEYALPTAFKKCL